MKRVELLSLFSPNETLEDISTRNLPFLFVPYVLAEVENRVRTNGRHERMVRIRSIQVRSTIQMIMSNNSWHFCVQAQYLAFQDALHTYEIVTESLKTLYSKQSTKVADPAKRRELKIKQYKQEKEFRSKINVCQSPPSCDRLTLTRVVTGGQKAAGADASTIRAHRL